VDVLADAVLAALLDTREDYASRCNEGDIVDPGAPISEADVVSEIRFRLLPVAERWGCHVHQEVRAVVDELPGTAHLKVLPRLDLVLLGDEGGESWLDAAKGLQDRYAKGAIEARFLAVPARFIRAAIEVKIQSLSVNARKDIDGLWALRERWPSCACFFVLLNARGRVSDHEAIRRHGEEMGIPVIEHTSRC